MILLRNKQQVEGAREILSHSPSISWVTVKETNYIRKDRQKLNKFTSRGSLVFDNGYESLIDTVRCPMGTSDTVRCPIDTSDTVRCVQAFIK